MAVYFFDSSALVKRYVLETGTNWVQLITDPTAFNSIFIAQVTGVEIITAITRRVRMRDTSQPDAALAIADFRNDFANQYSPIEVTDQVISRAMSLAEAHPLRAYDAIQLATALEVNDQSVALGMTGLGVPALTLVSADADLNSAAIREGLVVEDPNAHP